MKKINQIFKGLFDNTKNRLREIKDHESYRLYPSNPRHDDVYIVEFPKSGVTWLSTIITNVNLLISNKQEKATFYNLQQYIPDIHASLDLSYDPLWSFPKFRFIKSHDFHNKNYLFVIYLIRDPYKVMNSYYIFNKQLGNFTGTFEEFIRHDNFGIKAWSEHISSWLDRGVSNQKIHLVKYEDLINNPLDEIRNIYKNLGLLIDDNFIKNSINLSDMTNMKASEEFHKKYNPNYSHFQFIGKGQIDFDTIMSDKAKEYIKESIKSNKVFNDFYKD